MRFAQAFQMHLEASPDLRRRGRRVLAILKGRPSRRRTRQIERMEAHSRVQLGLPVSGAIDWSEIDWPSVIQQILALILKLIDLLA